MLSKCFIELHPPANFDPQQNWLHRQFHILGTLSDWVKYIDSLRQPVNFGPTTFTWSPPPRPYIPNTIPDIWCHRAEAAYLVEAYFQTSQRIRFQMRRLLCASRRHIMNRRVVGVEKDVGTLEPVAPRHQVVVYDWSTRSKYCFHVRTIHDNIMAALQFQCMGISRPTPPKNPYTNLPWSYCQLTVLYDQIQSVMWAMVRRHPNNFVQAFLDTDFNIAAFKEKYGDELDRECAHQFFFNPTSEYWDEIYEETLTDLGEHLLAARRNGVLREFVLSRSLPARLMSEWDNMIYGFWCFQNLNRMVLRNMCTIEDLVINGRTVVTRTMEFIREKREERIDKK